MLSGLPRIQLGCPNLERFEAGIILLMNGYRAFLANYEGWGAARVALQLRHHPLSLSLTAFAGAKVSFLEAAI